MCHIGYALPLPSSFFTPKNKKKRELEVMEKFPEFEFSWKKIDSNTHALVAVREAKPSVIRKRKALNYAKKAEIIANATTEVGKALMIGGVEVGSAWRPCIIDDSICEHNVEDYASKYYINKDGEIRVIDGVEGATIAKPYRRLGYYSIDFLNNGEHINQRVHCLLERSWGEEVAEEFKRLEETGEDLFCA